MHGHPIVHLEISANDGVAARKFYHDVFDWNITVFTDPTGNRMKLFTLTHPQ